MANRVQNPNVFATNAPNWSLAQLDANFSNTDGAINDSSLGATNGPLTDTGAANAYAVTCAYGAPSAYNNGMTVFFNPANTNTGASTLTVSPLSSLPIVSATGGALVGGELVVGSTIGVVCDGTAFRIFSQSVPSQIYAARLKSFNSVGNCTFELDQRQCGTNISIGSGTSNTFVCDRWQIVKSGTMTLNAQQVAGGTVIPGTSFQGSAKQLNITLAGQEASMAAADYLCLYQAIEGSVYRELSGDVTSFSLLVYLNQGAPFSFGLSLRDGAVTPTRTLTKLCSIPSNNTWTLISLPNLPKPSGGTFNITPGTVGYTITLTLACGSTNMNSANDTWQNTNALGAPGQGNFASLPVGTIFTAGLLQHEAGNVCTAPMMDKPFEQNFRECLRYYAKSYDLDIKPGTGSTNSYAMFFWPYAIAGAFTAYGGRQFAVPMAKNPTLTSYANNTGTINTAVEWFTSGSYGASPTTGAATISAITGSKNGIQALTSSGTAPGPIMMAAEWTADTGW